MHISLTSTALAKAKAFGLVLAALSAGGAGGVVALSQVSNSLPSSDVVVSADATTSPTDDPSASATPTPTATETESDSATTAPTASAYALPSCPPDVKNHGAYVSGVAHSAPHNKDGQGQGGEHGKWVSQAAHSDCGKSEHASDQPDSSDSESPKPAKSHEAKPEKPKPERSKPVQGTESTTDSANPTGIDEASPSVDASTGGKHESGQGDH